jgi:hypothetical protein
MSAFKPEIGADAQEFDAPPSIHQQKTEKLARVVESARLGLTVLALLSAITIVATAGDALAVYNTTHLSQEYLLPLWPMDFNMGPSVALVTCASIIVVASAASLLVSKVSAVSIFRAMALANLISPNRSGIAPLSTARYHSSALPYALSQAS